LGLLGLLLLPGLLPGTVRSTNNYDYYSSFDPFLFRGFAVVIGCSDRSFLVGDWSL